LPHGSGAGDGGFFDDANKVKSEVLFDVDFDGADGFASRFVWHCRHDT